MNDPPPPPSPHRPCHHYPTLHRYKRNKHTAYWEVIEEEEEDDT